MAYECIIQQVKFLLRSILEENSPDLDLVWFSLPYPNESHHFYDQHFIVRESLCNISSCDDDILRIYDVAMFQHSLIFQKNYVVYYLLSLHALSEGQRNALLNIQNKGCLPISFWNKRKKFMNAAVNMSSIIQHSFVYILFLLF